MDLFSFVGNSDLAAVGLGSAGSEGPGPVARAATSDLAEWSSLTLVNDRAEVETIERYADWLGAQVPKLAIRVHRHALANPASFELALTAADESVRAAAGAGERAYLATPGTSAMGMAWLYLATRPVTRGRLLTAHTGQPCAWVTFPPPGHCVILRGLPGSGKSTRARALAAQAGLPPSECVFSTDDRFEALNGGVYEAAQLTRMHQANLAAFIAALARGVPLVVCDNTNTEPWEYALYTASARALGYEVTVELVGDPDDAVHLEDCAARNVHGVSPERIREMARRLSASRAG